VIWRRIYGFIPVPVIYTDNLPERFGGLFCGLWIKIRPKYKHDLGLLEHELTHARQFWRTLGLYAILYQFRSWRLKFEVEGYRVQEQFYPRVDKQYYRLLFATFLAEKYHLKISVGEAYDALWGRDA
jgi:hypothetical protein